MNSKSFVPHFHIPLQSGSDKILRAMRRRYDTKLYKNRIKKIRSINPDTCIGVDVIVGFPGETDLEFKKTVDFIEDLEVSYLHVFSYSERLETEAIKLNDKVSLEIKKERSKILHELSEKKRNLFYNDFIGSKREVLFEYKKNGHLVGHTDNYIKVSIKTNKDLINKIVPVKLIENNGGFLNAVL